MTELGSNVRLGSNVQMGIDLGFSPLWFSGCVAWFDMQDPRSYAVTSGAVSDIVNKASGVVWTQGTSGARPAYSATGLNGLPCMEFDGTDDCIISTEANVAAAFNGTSPKPWTIFLVGNFDTPDRIGAAFSWGNASVNIAGGYVGQNNTVDGRWAVITTNNTPTTISTISAGDNNANNNVLEYWQTGTTVSISVNGATPDPSAGANDPGTTTVTRSGLGCRCRPNVDLFHDGKVAEVLVFNRELTAFERAVRTYLLRKWGIADPTPLTIMGALAWWVRADTGITIATGVSQWNDLSGNGVNFAQGTGANQPSLNSSAINRQPAVTFDGSNDLLFASFSRVAPGTQPFYWWLVAKQIAWASNKHIANDSGAALYQNTSTPNVRSYNGVNGPLNAAGVVGSYQRFETQFSSSTADYLKVGSTNVTGTNTGNAVQAGSYMVLGATFSGGSPASPTGWSNVEIGEAFMFLGTPTAEQRAWLDAYAFLRYGPTLGI